MKRDNLVGSAAVTAVAALIGVVVGVAGTAWHDHSAASRADKAEVRAKREAVYSRAIEAGQAACTAGRDFLKEAWQTPLAGPSEVEASRQRFEEAFLKVNDVLPDVRIYGSQAAVQRINDFNNAALKAQVVQRSEGEQALRLAGMCGAIDGLAAVAHRELLP